MSMSDFVKEAVKLSVIQAKAIIKGDRFQSRALYAVAGADGLYRRVSREGRSGIKKCGEDNILVCDDTGELLEVARYLEGEKELGLTAWLPTEEPQAVRVSSPEVSGAPF